MPKKAPSVYEYNNFRHFLRDFFDFQKDRKGFFSQRYFAARAGFKSHSFCVYLIKGKRNLSDGSIGKLSQALGLEGNGAEFFRTLVQYNQATNQAEKERLFRDLNVLRRNTTFFRLNQKQYAYFDHWYYPVIRELAVFSDWGGDFARLAAMLDPPITPREARKAVKALQDMDLIRQTAQGAYEQSAGAVTADDIPAHLIRKARDTYIRMALDASERQEKQQRNISCATVALSEETFREASKMIDQVREKIVGMSTEDTEPDKVYQINLQVFPLSSDVGAHAKRPVAQEDGHA